MKKQLIIGISGKVNAGKNYAELIMQHELWKHQTGGILTFESWYNSLHRSHSTGLHPLAFADTLKQVANVLLGNDGGDFNDRAFKEALLPERWQRRSTIEVDRLQVEDILTKEGADKAILEGKYEKLNPEGTRLRPTHQDKIFSGRTFLTTLGDALNSQVHPDIFVLSAMAKLNADKHYVFTDVRFPNEAEAIKKAGGYLLRVERSLYDRTGYFTDEELEEKNPIEYKKTQHRSEVSLDRYKGFDRVVSFSNDAQFRHTVAEFITPLFKQYEL